MVRRPPLRARRPEIAVDADAHLGSPAARAAELLRYLSDLAPETLVVLGDLLDRRLLRGGELPLRHGDVVRRLLGLAHQGTRAYVLTGNPDDALLRFGRLELGNLHVRRELTLRVDGRSYFFAHGHHLDAAVKYRLGAGAVGGRLARALAWADRGAARVGLALGRRPWSLARELRTDPAAADRYVGLFADAARADAQRRSADAAVCAHIHRPAVDGPPGAPTYLNPGDWVTNLSALEYAGGRWRVFRYDPDDYPLPHPRLRAGGRPERDVRPASVAADGPRVAPEAEPALLRAIVEHGPTRAA